MRLGRLDVDEDRHLAHRSAFLDAQAQLARVLEDRRHGDRERERERRLLAIARELLVLETVREIALVPPVLADQREPGGARLAAAAREGQRHPHLLSALDQCHPPRQRGRTQAGTDVVHPVGAVGGAAATRCDIARRERRLRRRAWPLAPPPPREASTPLARHSSRAVQSEFDARVYRSSVGTGSKPRRRWMDSRSGGRVALPANGAVRTANGPPTAGLTTFGLPATAPPARGYRRAARRERSPCRGGGRATGPNEPGRTEEARGAGTGPPRSAPERDRAVGRSKRSSPVRKVRSIEAKFSRKSFGQPLSRAAGTA